MLTYIFLGWEDKKKGYFKYSYDNNIFIFRERCWRIHVDTGTKVSYVQTQRDLKEATHC